MNKYVALLRGINVGGNNKVEMSKLKKIFEALGYKNVLTYINSGNIIFESTEIDPEKLTEEIERTLKKKFGFEIRCVLRDSDNIIKLTKTIPTKWTNDAEQKTDVLFLWKDFDHKDSIKLITTQIGVDNLKYIAGAIVWNISKENYSKSGMHKFIGTKIYKHMTARNVNTVRKLAELIG
jgi:uncharacterized protein (DUF1697 family)